MAGDFEFTVDVRGLERVIRENPRALETFMDAEAEEMVTDIKLSFNTSPPGRRYKRGQKGVHTASQPGYPPNVDMGTLRASIRWDNAGRFERDVMDGVEYGVMLEQGTIRMGARPFLGPAFERRRIGFVERLRLHLGMS